MSHTRGSWVAFQSVGNSWAVEARREPSSYVVNLAAGLSRDDAHLVSAAPDLLSACNLLRDVCTMAMSAVVRGESAEDLDAALRRHGINDYIIKSEAAIAKAEGR